MNIATIYGAGQADPTLLTAESLPAESLRNQVMATLATYTLLSLGNEGNVPREIVATYAVSAGCVSSLLPILASRLQAKTKLLATIACIFNTFVICSVLQSLSQK